MTTSLAVVSTLNWPTAGVATTIRFNWSSAILLLHRHYAGDSRQRELLLELTGLQAPLEQLTRVPPSQALHQQIPSINGFLLVPPTATSIRFKIFGVQYAPSSTTNAGDAGLSSNVFSLPAGTYIIDVTFDASSVTGSTNLPAMWLADATTGSALSGSTITSTSGQKVRKQVVLTTTQKADVYARIDFPSGMTTLANRSVIVSNLSVIPVSGNLTSSAQSGDIDKNGCSTYGPYWLPGGNVFTPNNAFAFSHCCGCRLGWHATDFNAYANC
jgi:hypothetical protein